MTKNIYVYPRGGLGNQLYATCVALIVAGIREVDLTMDLRNTSFRSSNLLDLEIIPNNSRTQIKFINSRSAKLANSLNILNFIFIRVSKFINPKSNFDNKMIDTAEIVDSIKHSRVVTVDGHYENMIYPKFSRETEFDFSIRMKKESENFAQFRKTLDSSTRTRIGVHVRKGDFKTWEGGVHLLPVSYYKKAIEAATHNITNYEIWVFTDEPGDIEEIRNLNPHALVLSEHFSLSDTEELVALSMMDQIVTSKSTFSQWSAILSKAIVYFPHNSQSMPSWVQIKY